MAIAVRAPALLPLVGAVWGAAGAGIYLTAARVLPVSMAALLTIVFWAGISGRIGTFGAWAILLSVLARWQALEHVAISRIFEVSIAAQAVPRAAMVALAWVSRPAGEGLTLSSTLTTPAALAAIAQGAAAALACGLRLGAVILAGAYLVIRLARWHSYRRMGGVNGNALAVTGQLLEIFVLGISTSAL